MHYIQSGKTREDVAVSIDGAHIRTKGTLHFDIVDFMKENGYVKCDTSGKWQGKYQNAKYSPCIAVSSTPGEGDVVIRSVDGRVLQVESKKFKSGNGGEYPAMHEAIGQLMTGCPDDCIPCVAVPYSQKSCDLTTAWLKRERMQKAGICFLLVHSDGHVELMEGNQ